MSNIFDEFIAFLHEQVENHSIYVWGAQGQTGATVNKEWIERRETTLINANRAIRLWEKNVAAGFGGVLHAYDCSGLGMYFFQNLKKIINYDMSANSLMHKCEEKTVSDLIKGDMVFICNSANEAKHVGYVINDNKDIIHAKGRDYGVVKEGLYQNGTNYWTNFGTPKFIKDKISIVRDLQVSSPYQKGNDVKELQVILNALKYNCGDVDGVFGNLTNTAMNDFITDCHNTVPNICNNTLRKILGLKGEINEN